MSRRYAEGTRTPTDKTRIEIEETLVRFGADSFASGFDAGAAYIVFRARGRWIKLVLPLPAITDPAFARTDTGRPRSPGSRQEAFEAERRRRWRSMALLVKAKLAAVQDRITEFDQEFMPYIVMGSGQTLWEGTKPQLERIAAGKNDRPLAIAGPRSNADG